jgi:hypothetical protein
MRMWMCMGTRVPVGVVQVGRCVAEYVDVLSPLRKDLPEVLKKMAAAVSHEYTYMLICCNGYSFTGMYWIDYGSD